MRKLSQEVLGMGNSAGDDDHLVKGQHTKDGNWKLHYVTDQGSSNVW